ncbi:MAG: 1-acyl-sn-glycerol-3-phosphate acyltransferase [Deltaproteobacteria bacterium]|nr:1-acyl-sn-glycerol-3-phosphate acyltransferase [Deltaproteobacteria bacterium]
MQHEQKPRLPKNPLADHITGKTMQFRVRTRSRLVGGSFSFINLFTRYDVEGREHLFEAVARAKAAGRGLITVSNHVSLFDDPMVLIAVLKLRNFNAETKAWWSTACASNFNPQGKGLGARATRWFNSTANMVFMQRAHKGCKAAALPPSLVEWLRPAVGWKRAELIQQAAAARGLDPETWLRSFVTAHPGECPTSLDQKGMVEACARVNIGDWLHFFPEGGRSRDMSLRPARPGAGKVIYHSPDAEVVPLCFYGSQDVLPIGAVVPRPFKRVVVSVGKPLSAPILAGLRRGPATPETFGEISKFALSGVAALRPAVLARYLGAMKAFDLLAEEQAEEALVADAPAAALEPAESVPWSSVLAESEARADHRADL